MKKNKKPNISVIIPIYNAEDTLLNCLSSIQNQTFNNIEIICIDDCSNDNSNNILKELSLKDDRIIILNNVENIGPGPSRNKGIDIAKGDYLTFIDSDDYIDPNLLEALYDKAVYGYFDIVVGDQKYKSIDNDTLIIKRKQIIERSLSQGKPLWLSFHDCHQGALYKKTLFDDKQIRYGTTYMGEDSLFLLKMGHKADSIGFLKNNGPYYHRVCSPGSLSNNYADKDILNEIIKGLHDRIGYIKPEADTDGAIDYFIKKILHMLSIHRYLCSYESDLDLSNYFLDVIRKEAMNFPNIELIKKKNYIIKALVDYNVNLTTSCSLSLRSVDMLYYENCIKQWIDFAFKHPDLKKEWKLELINILSKKRFTEENQIRLTCVNNAADDYSKLLDNELEKCTFFTKFEKCLIGTISFFRKNNYINITLSKIKKHIRNNSH